MPVRDQDLPYGTVTIVSTAATFSDSQTGILANGRVLMVIPQGQRVVSALAATGLTCTLAGSSDVTNAGINYSGRQSAPVSS